MQRYRARSSVVLTGSGTVLSRRSGARCAPAGAARQPLRVILDSALRVPAQARVFARPTEALVFTASTDVARRAELERRGISVELAAAARRGVLRSSRFCAASAQLEANEVWVEAGARLSGALLAAGLVDELIVYMAPSLLGPRRPDRW